MFDLVFLISVIAAFVILINGLSKSRGYAGFLGCAACPTGIIPSVAEETCLPDFQLITRLVFQKETAPQDEFTPVSILLQATWVTKLAAIDDTKITLTPRASIKKVTFTPGDFERTTDTVDGSERTLGKVKRDKVMFMFENLSPAQFTSLQNLFCYNLVVYFGTTDNNVWGKRVGLNIQGFPTRGKIVMNTPAKGEELIAPRNFAVEFSLDDAFWYSFLVETQTPFINIL